MTTRIPPASTTWFLILYTIIPETPPTCRTILLYYAWRHPLCWMMTKVSLTCQAVITGTDPSARMPMSSRLDGGTQRDIEKRMTARSSLPSCYRLRWKLSATRPVRRSGRRWPLRTTCSASTVAPQIFARWVAKFHKPHDRGFWEVFFFQFSRRWKYRSVSYLLEKLRSTITF